jgi:hypothetical protein
MCGCLDGLLGVQAGLWTEESVVGWMHRCVCVAGSAVGRGDRQTSGRLEAWTSVQDGRTLIHSTHVWANERGEGVNVQTVTRAENLRDGCGV